MALGNITASNLISQSFLNVRALVNTISDPSDRGEQWLFSTFPQEKKGTADTYPCIIIESPDLVGENIVFGHGQRRYKWTVPISIYARQKGTADILADSVISTIETNKGSLESNGQFQINFTASPSYDNVINNQIIHEKRVVLECEGCI